MIYRDQLIQTFIMDGNFSAEHMRARTREADILLSTEMAFMVSPGPYKAHLHSGQEINQACSAFLPCHSG